MGKTFIHFMCFLFFCILWSACDYSPSHGPDKVKLVVSSCTGRDATGHQRHPAGRHHHDTLRVSQDHRGAAGGEDQRQAELHSRGEAGGGAAGG